MSRRGLTTNGGRDSSVVGDGGIRSALRIHLEQQWAAHSDTRFIEELGICRGRVRIDLAVVNGALHGYEIKSDRDRLDRLAVQVEIYGMVVDRATIVAGPKHLEDVLRIVPDWWGVLRVVADGESVRIEAVRPSRENPEQVARALAELLWREEALTLLESRQAAHGVRSKPRAAVWDRVCEAFDLGEIGEAVRAGLRSRVERSAPA
jgi:hypothetical protein